MLKQTEQEDIDAVCCDRCGHAVYYVSFAGAAFQRVVAPEFDGHASADEQRARAIKWPERGRPLDLTIGDCRRTVFCSRQCAAEWLMSAPDDALFGGHWIPMVRATK